MTERLRGSAATVATSAVLVVAGAGLAATARAEPPVAPAPAYHWCPGDDWDRDWGFNWEWALCHDDHHRDIDGDYHGYDYPGPPPPGASATPWYPPQPDGPPLWWRP
ncbi:MAG: hypothetical protein JO152_05675 [Mycobacteriaceae bacterium]|nr:hypothetical protein [Mycobacteriaceae bacterium]